MDLFEDMIFNPPRMVIQTVGGSLTYWRDSPTINAIKARGARLHYPGRKICTGVTHIITTIDVDSSNAKRSLFGAALEHWNKVKSSNPTAVVMSMTHLKDAYYLFNEQLERQRLRDAVSGVVTIDVRTTGGFVGF